MVDAGGAVESLALRRAGPHIYLAGIASGGRRLVAMRLDANGHLDRDFGDGGRLSTPVAKSVEPGSIVATRVGVLVTLTGGSRPVVRFDDDGKVRREWPGTHPQAIDNLRATASAGHLILGWGTYQRRSSPSGYFLRKSSLRR